MKAVIDFKARPPAKTSPYCFLSATSLVSGGIRRSKSLSQLEEEAFFVGDRHCLTGFNDYPAEMFTLRLLFEEILRQALDVTFQFRRYEMCRIVCGCKRSSTGPKYSLDDIGPIITAGGFQNGCAYNIRLLGAPNICEGSNAV